MFSRQKALPCGIAHQSCDPVGRRGIQMRIVFRNWFEIGFGAVRAERTAYCLLNYRTENVLPAYQWVQYFFLLVTTTKKKYLYE